MRRLAGVVELLDGPLDRATLNANLRDLERTNRWLGGAALSWRALGCARQLEPGKRTFALLDVGTGAGDIPRYLLRRARANGVDLAVTATDTRPEIVDRARELASGVDGLTVALAGGEQLEFEDASFDFVHTSLVVHHLEPEPATRLLREMGRIARTAVLVNDLTRGPRWWLAAWLMSHVATANRYTRHDAPLSVARAYRPDELAAFAAEAGLKEVGRYWTRPAYRYALVLRRA